MVLSSSSFFEAFLSVCAAEKSGVRKVQTEATHGAVTLRPAAASRGRKMTPARLLRSHHQMAKNWVRATRRCMRQAGTHSGPTLGAPVVDEAARVDQPDLFRPWLGVCMVFDGMPLNSS